jgi:hypothetical protein
MRKLQSAYCSERFEKPRVFVDDLEELFALLGSLGLATTITSGGHEFVSISELKEKRGGYLRDLKIKAIRDRGYPYIEVTFSRFGAELTISDMNELGPDAFRVRDLFRTFQISNARVLGFEFWWVVGVTVFLLAWVPGLPAGSSGVLITASIGSYGVGLALAALSTRLTGVHLRRKHEAGFWQRNRESIALLAIGAVLGAIATTFAERLFGK